MPKVLKDGENRKTTVTISVDPENWKALQTRCDEMSRWLMAKGVPEKSAKKFNRSALIRGCVQLACKREYMEFLRLVIGEQFGVDDSQMELDL